jgi:MFS family permease
MTRPQSPITPTSVQALPPAGWRQTFASFQVPSFAWYFGATMSMFFATQMMVVLRGWLVLDLTDRESSLGVIMATVALPWLVLSPLGGIVADRVDKRTLLIWTQSFITLINLANTVLIITGLVQFWHLVVLSTLSGSAFGFNMPGRQAIVPELVGKERLMNAISLTTGGMNASRIMGPALAGILVAPIGIGGGFALLTSFYAFSVFSMWRVPSTGAVARTTEFTFTRDLAEGFQYVTRTALVLGLLLFATVPVVFAMPYQTLMPAFADKVWDVGALGLGILQAAAGVGGLIGALLMANMEAYPRKGLLMFMGALGFGVFLVAFALSPSFYAALPLLCALSLAAMVYTTVNNTVLQTVVPDEVRGRVMSVMMMSWGLMPLGAVPAAFLAEAYGTPLAVAGGAVLLILFASGIYLATPTFRHVDHSVAEAIARRRQLPSQPLPAHVASREAPSP